MGYEAPQPCQFSRFIAEIPTSDHWTTMFHQFQLLKTGLFGPFLGTQLLNSAPTSEFLQVWWITQGILDGPTCFFTSFCISAGQSPSACWLATRATSKQLLATEGPFRRDVHGIPSGKVTYCGWLRNPNHQLKTVGLSHCFVGFNMFQPSKMVQDFCHPP